MKNISHKISSLGVICLFMIIPFYSQAQTNQQLIESLQTQLRTLLVDLVEQLQAQLEQTQKDQDGEQERDEDKSSEEEEIDGEDGFYGSKSSQAVQLGDDTIAKFKFELRINAFGGSYFINEDGSDFSVALTNGDVISTTISETTARLTNDNSYEISEGSPEVFMIEVQTASSAGAGIPQSIRATIDSVVYSENSDLTGAPRTLNLGAPDYKSGTVTVVDAY